MPGSARKHQKAIVSAVLTLFVVSSLGLVAPSSLNAAAASGCHDSTLSSQGAHPAAPDYPESGMDCADCPVDPSLIFGIDDGSSAICDSMASCEIERPDLAIFAAEQKVEYALVCAARHRRADAVPIHSRLSADVVAIEPGQSINLLYCRFLI